MAVIRLKPTSYIINYRNSSVANAEIFVSNREPEDIASSSAYYAHLYGSDRYEGPSVSLYFPAVNVNNITNITLKYRAYDASHQSGTGASEGAIELCADNPSQVIKLRALSENNLVMTDNDCLSYNIPQEYWSIILESNWYLRVVACTRTTGTANTYAAPLALDIEYTPTNDFKIGTNKLDEAHLGEGWISKIYKGAVLLFEKEKPLLPRAYQQLKYIQGTGTQYIDTGIKMNSSVDIEADAEIRQFAWQRDNAPSDLAGIFGNVNCGDSGGNRAGLRFYTQRNYYWYYSNTGWPTVWPSDETFYSRNIYKNVGNVFYINGTSTITGTAGTWSDATNNAFLFSMGENQRAGMKLFRAKLWDNNILVRDMYPAKRKSDNAVGLYDVVSKTFFGNAGTGNFYESIPDEYQEVEYIQSNGNGHNTGQHIDTGYFPTDGDVFRANMTVMPLSAPNTEREYLAKYGNGGTNIQIGHNSNSWNMSNTDTLFRYTQNSPSNAVNNKTFIDGQITISGTSSVSLYLFAQNESPGNTNSVWDSSIRLYACTITVNGVPIRNYVPCYRKSDGVIGLYDTINKQFKINEGTGSFTKGPDVN